MINSVSSILSEKIETPINKRLNTPPFLVVVEDGKQSDIKRLYLENLPLKSYAISLDIAENKFCGDERAQFLRLNHYLNKSNDKGINKRCDLVLFTEEGIDNTESIYIFDLKSSDPDPEEVCMQLVNSEIFIKYILELVKFFNKTDISKVSFYKVVCTTRVRKRVPYANIQLRTKLARKNTFYETYQVKEVTVLPEHNKKARLNFTELSRLF